MRVQGQRCNQSADDMSTSAVAAATFHDHPLPRFASREFYASMSDVPHALINSLFSGAAGLALRVGRTAHNFLVI